MGFWSALKNIGKIGSVAAAPFTGGASLKALPIIDAIGNVASGAAQGSANARNAEAPNVTDAYRANLSGLQFNANEQDRGTRRQALSSLLGNLQDVNIGLPQGSTIPQFNITGGLRPSALGEIGSASRNALLQALQQPTFSAQPLELPQAGTLEKVLGGIGLGANAISQIGGAIANRRNPAKEQAQARTQTGQGGDYLNIPPIDWRSVPGIAGGRYRF